MLRPELRLLAASCIGGVQAPTCGTAEEQSHERVDWARLVELAEHHGTIAPLLESLVNNNNVPDQILRELQSRYHAGAMVALWLTRELDRVLDCLAHHAIDALPYKGPVLSELLYGTVSWRQFSDNDILIHAKDVPLAAQALAEIGYRPTCELSRAQQRRYMRSGYELPFHAEQAPNVLEVQWQILPRFYAVQFEAERLFDRAVRLPLGARTVSTLCHEDLLLVMCVHAAKHAWTRLSWLADVARLIETRTINWEHVEREADRMHVRRIVAITFLLAHQILGSQLPEATGRFKADRQCQRIVDEVTAHMNRDEEFSTKSPAYFHLMLAARERNVDRMRFITRLAFTPGMEEWKIVKLPEPLYPLYQVIRMGRLLSRLTR